MGDTYIVSADLCVYYRGESLPKALLAMEEARKDGHKEIKLTYRP
jgi:hypothetical protein